MRSFYVAVVLIVGTAQLVMAQLPQKFDACVAKSGTDYVKARDQFLAEPANKKLLDDKFKSNVWQEKLTAFILQGWQQHTQRYRQLLAEPKIASATGSTSYTWSGSAGGITANDVPLMYELLLKDIDASAAFDAARALVGLVQAKPDTALDIHLLHQFLQDAKNAQAPGRANVAWLIGALPAKYQDEQDVRASLQAELALKSPDRDSVKSLLEGLGRAATLMTGANKDKLVQALIATKGLEAAAGKVPLLYALGTIGGDKGTDEVAKYLKGTADESQQRWALNLLSRTGSEKSRPILAEFAAKESLALAKEAVAGYHRLPYSDGVRNDLNAIALNEKAPEAIQREAMLSLVTISAKNSTNKDIQKQIQATLQTISSKSKNEKLTKELEKILKGL